MNRRRLARYGSSSIVVALAAILLLPASVLADTELGHRGLVGLHRLRDTADRPGATCYYGEAGRLRGIGVRPPRVLARDVTAGVDQQRVSWQFVIQRRANPSSDWRLFFRSSMQNAVAWDNEPAHFNAMTVAFRRPAGDDPLLTEYRVNVRMLWWRHAAVEGLARHRVDWYRWKGVDTMVVGPGGACGAEWVIV